MFGGPTRMFSRALLWLSTGLYTIMFADTVIAKFIRRSAAAGYTLFRHLTWHDYNCELTNQLVYHGSA